MTDGFEIESTIHQDHGKAQHHVVAIAVTGVIHDPTLKVIHGVLRVQELLALFVLTGFWNEGQSIQHVTVVVFAMAVVRQPLASTLTGSRITFEWEPFVDVAHELFVVLGIERQLVVDREDQTETVLGFGMALGRVDQELVVLHQQLDRAQIDPTIHVDHHQVETWNAVLFVAVATIEMVGHPVQARCLSQLAELVKRRILVAIVRCDVRAVAHDHLREVCFFKSLASQELDAIAERFLDDHVVLVSPRSCQCEHFGFLCSSTAVEGQVLSEVSLSDITFGCAQILGELHIRTIACEQLVERVA